MVFVYWCCPSHLCFGAVGNTGQKATQLGSGASHPHNHRCSSGSPSAGRSLPICGTLWGGHTHCFHQAVCAPLLVTVFVAEAAGDSQAGWCESSVRDAWLVRVPGASVQGRQAAVDLVQSLWPLHLDQGCIARCPVPVRRSRRRGGP